MASGPEHYREAERLLTHPGLDTNDPGPADALLIQSAQVHATLAVAAATVEQVSARGPGDVGRDWIEATS